MQSRPTTLRRLLPCLAISFSSFIGDQCLAHSISTASDLEVRQSPANPDARSFLRRGFQASTVVNEWIYIDGGQYSITDNQQYAVSYASTTLSIDLSQDWVNSTVTFKNSAKPSNAPSLNQGSLWYNQAKNVLYTGFTGGASYNTHIAQTLPDPSLWAFALDGLGSGTWSSVISSSDEKWLSLNQPTPSNTLQSFGPTEALILGGNSQNPDILLPGYVRFDMGSLTFTNVSGTSYDGVGGVQGGTLTYVPSFGPQGIYISMGGESFNIIAGLLSFQYVSVFDPSINKWYNQTTTGQPPSPRINFCSASIDSTNETVEIFVYGGWGTELGEVAIQYDTISILTLPAFNWISVPYNTANPRHGHSCNAVGGSQIISIGGVDSNPNATFNGGLNRFASKDPYAQGLAIFDMTKLQWASKYTASMPPYEQSGPIQDYYKSNNGAYLQGLAPPVKLLMSQTHFTSAPNVTNSTSPSSTPVPPSSTPISTSPNHAGAIAGGVIGGLIALVLLAGIVLFLLRRRRRRHDKLQPTINPNHYPNNDNGGYIDDASESKVSQSLHSSPNMAIPQQEPHEVSAMSPPVELQDQAPFQQEAWEAPGTIIDRHARN